MSTESIVSQHLRHRPVIAIRSMFWTVLVTLCWTSNAYTKVLNIELLEMTYEKTGTNKTDGSPAFRKNWVASEYVYDLETMTLERGNAEFGENVQTIEDYKIKGDDFHPYKLDLGGRDLASANEILYQCNVQQKDVVIVRNEYNSYSGFRALAALSGHPVQISQIMLYVVQGGRIVDGRMIVENRSYEWKANVRN